VWKKRPGGRSDPTRQGICKARDRSELGKSERDNGSGRVLVVKGAGKKNYYLQSSHKKAHNNNEKAM
jgi:hypothetical protein